MPQLDLTTFFSQLVISIVLFIIVFFVFSSVILPELYRIQRVRYFAFEEAEFQIENISSLFWLINFIKRTSVDSLTDESQISFSIFDSSEKLYSEELVCYDDSLLDYDALLEAEVADEFVIEDLGYDLIDYINLDIRMLEVEANTLEYASYNVPSVEDIFDSVGVFYNFEVDYKKTFAYLLLDVVDIDFNNLGL